MATSSPFTEDSISVGDVATDDLSSDVESQLGKDDKVLSDSEKFKILNVDVDRPDREIYVYSGKTRRTSWIFICIFGSVVTFSSMASLPMYAFSQTYRDIETYPVAYCNISFADFQYQDIPRNIFINATYTDLSTNESNWAIFSRDFNGQFSMPKHLKSLYEKELNTTVFPCYYNKHTMAPTIYTTIIIDYVTKQGWVMSVALLSVWSVIILITFVIYYSTDSGHEKVQVTKKENSLKDPDGEFQIIDWDDVDEPLIWPLYAAFYAYFVDVKANGHSRPVGKVSFMNYTRRPGSKTLMKCLLIPACLLTTGFVVMFVESCFQKKLEDAQALWCVPTIASIIPSILFTVTFFYVTPSRIRATVRVTKSVWTENGKNRLELTYRLSGTYYPSEKPGHLLSLELR